MEISLFFVAFCLVLVTIIIDCNTSISTSVLIEFLPTEDKQRVITSGEHDSTSLNHAKVIHITVPLKLRVKMIVRYDVVYCKL